MPSTAIVVGLSGSQLSRQPLPSQPSACRAIIHADMRRSEKSAAVFEKPDSVNTKARQCVKSTHSAAVERKAAALCCSLSP